MMEENKNTFLTGGDALVNLAEFMHKKYFTTFVWVHPFSMYVSYALFFQRPPHCTHMYAFRVTTLLRP